MQLSTNGNQEKPFYETSVLAPQGEGKVLAAISIKDDDMKSSWFL